MFSIDNMSRTPVYEQIIDQTEQYISVGILKPGDPMPSVRSLSNQLSVNPNTIQRSFTEMNNRGLTIAVPGRGSFISEKAPEIIRQKGEEKLTEFKELARRLRLAGISEEELLEAVRTCMK